MAAKTAASIAFGGGCASHQLGQAVAIKAFDTAAQLLGSVLLLPTCQESNLLSMLTLGIPEVSQKAGCQRSLLKVFSSRL